MFFFSLVIGDKGVRLFPFCRWPGLTGHATAALSDLAGGHLVRAHVTCRAVGLSVRPWGDPKWDGLEGKIPSFEMDGDWENPYDLGNLHVQNQKSQQFMGI